MLAVHPRIASIGLKAIPVRISPSLSWAAGFLVLACIAGFFAFFTQGSERVSGLCEGLFLSWMMASMFTQMVDRPVAVEA